MIKGHVTIDLHNHNSGFTERIEQDNLVTDAVGILASAYAGANRTDQIMPIAKKALGGIMLFDGELAEERSNIFFPSDAHLTGFAGQWMNTSNPFCGSLNVQETHATDTGYETVWDFSTSQANGTIASLALTAAPGGDVSNNPFTGINKDITIHETKEENSYVRKVAHAKDQIMYRLLGIENKVTYDESKKLYTTKAGISVKRAYTPISEYKVADWVNRADEAENLKDIELTVESIGNNALKGINAAEFLLNGYDGYAYMFYSDGNSDGDGSFSYQRVKLSDYSFDVEDPIKVTLPGTKLRGTIYGGIICKGKCFAVGKDIRYVYIVDLANTADVKTADIGEGRFCNVYHRIMADPGGTVRVKAYKKKSGKENVYEISDAIVYPDGGVRINRPYGETTEYSLNHNAYSNEYTLVTEGLIAYGDVYETGKINKGHPMMNYLGTICNLTTPVTKTAATSMKITYTLTDEVQV